MDDVELIAAVTAAQRGRCLRIGRQAARVEREQLDVEIRDPPQRLDLVADEAAEGGPFRARIHVRDDQRTHAGGERTPGLGRSPGAARARCLSRPPASPPVALAPSSADDAFSQSSRSPCSIPASAASPSCTSCSCRCRPRTTCTSATRRASRTATARRTNCGRSAIEIADHLLDAGAKLLVVACNSASAAALEALERAPGSGLAREIDVIGVLAAGRAARGRRQPHRPDRAARDARDGRERCLRASRGGGRSARAPRERRVPGPRADHPGRVPVRRARGRDGARLLRAAS